MKLSSPQISEKNAPHAKASGTRLLKRRLKVGLSQMALSDATGISKSMISRLENGERIGSFQVWRKLASTLGTTMARLTADG